MHKELLLRLQRQGYESVALLGRIQAAEQHASEHGVYRINLGGFSFKVEFLATLILRYIFLVQVSS